MGGRVVRSPFPLIPAAGAGGSKTVKPPLASSAESGPTSLSMT